LTRSNVGCGPRRKAGVRPSQRRCPDGRAPIAPRGNCADPLHRLRRCRALSALLHRSTRRQGGLSGDPVNVALANSWIVINGGGGPTDDKPTVILETPRDPDRVSSFLNIRVKDIEAVYAEWSARGAEFLTPPKQHQFEKRCYIRDPDGHLIEVGQTTDPEGDWSPAHWPSSAPPTSPSECRDHAITAARQRAALARRRSGSSRSGSADPFGCGVLVQAEQVGEDGCGQLGGEVTGTSWRPSRMNVVPPRQVPQVAGTRGHRTPLTIPRQHARPGPPSARPAVDPRRPATRRRGTRPHCCG